MGKQKTKKESYHHGRLRGKTAPIDLDTTTAVWAYIHGITMIRIDKLYPADLPEPDWDRLVRVVLKIPDTIKESHRLPDVDSSRGQPIFTRLIEKLLWERIIPNR